MARYFKWQKNPGWVRVVQLQACVRCGASGRTDAHHVGNGGMSKKVPDSLVMPLCHECHMSHHQQGVPSIDECREWLEDFWTLAGCPMPGSDERAQYGARRLYEARMAPVWDEIAREWLRQAKRSPERCADSLRGLFQSTKC